MEPTLPIRATVVVRGTTPVVGHRCRSSGGVDECGPKPHTIKPGRAACDASVSQESKVDVVPRIVAGSGEEILVRGGHVYRRTNGSGLWST
jgi:hypothetical protein